MINGNIGGYISCCISMLIRIQASGDKLGMLLCKAGCIMKNIILVCSLCQEITLCS